MKDIIYTQSRGIVSGSFFVSLVGEILKCLIETNIRQRGIGNTNPVKFGRCLKELERIYGVREGRPEKLPNYSAVKTQSDMASELGISVDTIQNYKQLADMIPEMRDLVETGIVTPTTARAIAKQLPEFQQKELAEQLSGEDRKTKSHYTKRDIWFPTREISMYQRGKPGIKEGDFFVAIRAVPYRAVRYQSGRCHHSKIRILSVQMHLSGVTLIPID